MIVVIADDITGAAEIGGIGLRYGLKVLLSADVAATDADLLVVYTNTRSMQEADAVNEMRVLTDKVASLDPSLFYKKTDSVLRGHVLAEMKTQMEALGLTKALLVPVNPLLGRTIQNGTYYINGKPVHEAGFATDPEFPISNSAIEAMLGAVEGEVQLRTVADQLSQGITVGEASTMREVKEWAARSEEGFFYAGGASFFAAMLHQRFVGKKVDTKPTLSLPLMLVSGTTYQQSLIKQAAFGEHVCQMPAGLFQQPGAAETSVKGWAAEIEKHLAENQKCILSVRPAAGVKADPEMLRKKMSETVVEVLKSVTIEELLIEGGATSFSIIQELGLHSFSPTEELQQGVVRMKVVGKDDLYLTIKPGSYTWPEAWEQAFS
jgi:uncharacterized protein YgbK (DUF1537 family)